MLMPSLTLPRTQGNKNCTEHGDVITRMYLTDIRNDSLADQWQEFLWVNYTIAK